MQVKRYNGKMRLMHWIMSPLVILMLIAGLYMTSDLVSDQYRFTIYFVHKSTGILLLMLLLVRIVVRARSKVPAPSEGISSIEQKLAIAGHHSIYLLALFIPISGYLMSDFADYPVSFFGLTLPSLFAKNQALSHFFNTAHTVLNYIFIALLFVHVIAPFKHYFVDRVNVWKRML